MTGPWQERFIEAGGYRTCYVEAGAGEPVLLLHSVDPGCSAALEYRHNIAPLAEHFRVIAPDLVGFGNTAPPRGTIESASALYWRHILAFMDSLGLDRTHLVGNSRGGLIAIAIAAAHPRRVGSMILLGNAGGGPTPEYMAKQAALYSDFTPQPEKLRFFLSGSFFSLERDVPPEIFDQYLANAVRQYAAYAARGGFPQDVPDLRPDLAKMQIPILYIFGREDQRWPPLEQALDTYVATPDARFYVLPRCGHHPQTEYPEEFNLLAIQFLKGLGR